jgi:hypothetical protein
MKKLTFILLSFFEFLFMILVGWFALMMIPFVICFFALYCFVLDLDVAYEKYKG